MLDSVERQFPEPICVTINHEVISRFSAISIASVLVLSLKAYSMSRLIGLTIRTDECLLNSCSMLLSLQMRLTLSANKCGVESQSCCSYFAKIYMEL